MKKIISTENAPMPQAHYSQAVVSEKAGLIFVAGQLGFDPKSGVLVSDNVGDQTRQAMENIKQILLAAGSDMDHVLKVTIFLQRIEDFAAMNAVYSDFFPTEPPARLALQAGKIPANGLVEIEAIAEVAG